MELSPGPWRLGGKDIMENLDLLAGSTGDRHVIDMEMAAQSRYAIFWVNIQINLERKLAKMKTAEALCGGGSLSLSVAQPTSGPLP